MTKIEKINKKAGLAGNISILSFSKFRFVATIFFIVFSAISLSLIAAAWSLKFDIQISKEIETHIIVFAITLPLSFPLAWYAGFTKINEVMSIVFARTHSFRFASLLAAIFTTSLIILVNSYGVAAGAEISSLYLENKLLNSEEYKTKQAISDVFSKISGASLGAGYKDLILEKKQEKSRLKTQQKQEVINYEKSNLVSYQKAENIAWINRKYDKKYKKIADEIQELTKLQIIQATKNEKLTLAKAEKYKSAEIDKLDYKKKIDESNKEEIEFYSEIGLWVAVVGEVIDLFLALIYFYKIKTNDNNSDETLVIQKGVNAPVMKTIKTTHKEKEEVQEQGKLKPLIAA